MSTYGLNDVYGVDELEATGSAIVEAHERVRTTLATGAP